MKFPATPEEVALNNDRIINQKLISLDVILPQIITHKIIIDSCLFDDRVYKPLARDVAKVVKKRINPPVLEAIFSPDPLFGHDLQTPKNWQTVCRADDVIMRLVRDLVEYAYDDEKVPLDLIRKKTTGCLFVVIYYLNDQDFLDELMQLAPDAAIKPIEAKRRNIYWTAPWRRKG